MQEEMQEADLLHDREVIKDEDNYDRRIIKTESG